MLTLPEIVGLDSHIGSVRIPPELDVPLTPRVRRIMDTKAFRRLAKMTQVGLVSLVYPAARHTRFEHSLGVYRLALLFLKRLAHIPRFNTIISQHDAELLIVTALLHDIGHWPFCHLIEDIRIKNLPHHEQLAANILRHSDMMELLRDDWNIKPESVIELLSGNNSHNNSVIKLLSSILSGPIDIDKMDYLFRDSLHAGVPYGRNLDQARLIGSLCVNKSGSGMAITEKGKTAAELMIFARYIMFSEVYWHHAVRAATAMFQRLFIELYQEGKIELPSIFEWTEDDVIRFLVESSQKLPIQSLAEGLFGTKRCIYKRVAQFSILEQPEIYRKLAGKPYRQLCELANHLAAMLPENNLPFSVLIDAPPIEKEIEIKIDVFYPKENCYRSLEDISPVVRAMAREQFDDYTKRVRIFAHPDVAVAFRENRRIVEFLEKMSME
ncbi:MAG: HD domain-containing protein [Planctomycetaceae bacterium]|jgi:HD superfamily phosphohydrolase|nr:HD domain-containing protein [Planctomycetaceae bacterium]